MAKSNFIVRGGYDANEITKGLLKTQKQLGKFQDKTQKQLEKAQIKIENSSLKRLNKMQSKYQKTQSGLSKAIKGTLATLSTVAIGSFIKDSTSMAMAVESSTDNISRNMGQSSKEFEEWVNTQSKGLGIAKKDAYTYGSTFSNLLGSFQSSTKETADSTQELMKASAIIASKTGRTYDDVSNRIRSGMLGSTEAIEDLGVYTNISMIESTNAFKKFANGKSWSQLDFKVQQQIRLAAILEQTYSRYGDTLADTTQTKQARFLASLSNIKLNIGQAFLPIYNVVLPALTTLGNLLESLTSKLSVLSQAFFGKVISIQTSEIESGSNAIGEYGDEIEEAGKKAKKSIAPFDELNQISGTGGGNKSGAGGTSGGGSNKPSTDIKVIETDTGFTKWMDKVKESINPTVKALGRLKNALKPLGKLALDNLKSFYKDTLKPIGEWILGEGLPRLLEVGTGLLNKIKWDSLSSALKNLNEAIAPFAISVGTGLITFIEGLGRILEPVLATTSELLAKGINAIGDAIKAIPEEVAIAIGGAIGGIATSLLLFSGATAIAGIITKIKSSLGLFFDLIAKHPVIAIASALAGIAGAFLSLEAVKFKGTELGKYVEKLNELQKSAKDANREIAEFLDNQKEKRSNIEGQYGAIQTLADKYFELADQTSLSNEEQLLMQTYANELVKAIPGLSELIDTQTGAYKGTREEIENLIEKTKEYYLVQAAQESLIEIAKKQYDEQKRLSELEKEQKKIKDDLGIKQEKYNKLLEIGGGQVRAVTKEEREAFQQKMKLSGEISILNKEMKDNNQAIETTQTSLTELNTEWDYATGYILEYSNSNETAKKAIDETKSSVVETSKAITKENIPEQAKKAIQGFNTWFKNDASTSSTVSGWLKGIKNTFSNFKLPNLKVGLDVNTSSLNALGNVNLKMNANPSPIAAYATGGFPSDGELFLGNENGIEMMGRMGNQNVVANNKQITDGIEQAAYNGFTRALKENGGLKANVKVEADSKGIFKVVQDESTEYSDRTGKPAFGF